MKKTTKLLILLFVILGACSTYPSKFYPQYIRQKDKIDDIVIASDYLIYKSEFGNEELIGIDEQKKLATRYPKK
jgi:hypothetical protein